MYYGDFMLNNYRNMWGLRSAHVLWAKHICRSSKHSMCEDCVYVHVGTA